MRAATYAAVGTLCALGWLLAPSHGAAAAQSHAATAAHTMPAYCHEETAEIAPCGPSGPAGGAGASPRPRGYTGLGNPAIGKTVAGADGDPLAGFTRRPLDRFIIPEGGLYLDPLHNGPHYGVDYANPDDYLNGSETYFHPIGPGYVTTRATCLMCFVDGDAQGRVGWKWPQYNFGWGGLVLVETPLSADVSIYVLYAHLNRDFVSLGDYVTPEDVIGVVGTTGYSEEFHLHVEVRFGRPGRFWNADFSQRATLDRWMATMFADPALLIFPQNHPAFLTAIEEWRARAPHPVAIP